MINWQFMKVRQDGEFEGGQCGIADVYAFDCGGQEPALVRRPSVRGFARDCRNCRRILAHPVDLPSLAPDPHQIQAVSLHPEEQGFASRAGF